MLLYGFSQANSVKISMGTILNANWNFPEAEITKLYKGFAKRDPLRIKDKNKSVVVRAEGGKNHILLLTAAGKLHALFKLNELYKKKHVFPARKLHEVKANRIVRFSCTENEAVLLSLTGEIFQWSFNASSFLFSCKTERTVLEQIPEKVQASKCHYICLTKSRLPELGADLAEVDPISLETWNANDLLLFEEDNDVCFECEANRLYCHSIFLSQSETLEQYVSKNGVLVNGVRVVPFPFSHSATRHLLLMLIGNVIHTNRLSEEERKELASIAKQFNLCQMLLERGESSKVAQESFRFVPSLYLSHLSHLFTSHCSADKESAPKVTGDSVEDYWSFRESANKIAVDMPSTDFQFVCAEENYVLPLHKCVARARCKYLNALLTSGMKESQQARVEFSDTKPLVLFHLVRFLYTGKFEPKKYGSDKFDLDSSVQLMLLAERYLIPGLKILCEKFIGTEINFLCSIKKSFFKKS